MGEAKTCATLICGEWIYQALEFQESDQAWYVVDWRRMVIQPPGGRGNDPSTVLG